MNQLNVTSSIHISIYDTLTSVAPLQVCILRCMPYPPAGNNSDVAVPLRVCIEIFASGSNSKAFMVAVPLWGYIEIHCVQIVDARGGLLRRGYQPRIFLP